MLKRKLLVEAGLPRRVLRMTVVIDAGQGHAVLTLILDNRVDAVLPAAEVGYEFINRESSHMIGRLVLEPRAPDCRCRHGRLQPRPIVNAPSRTITTFSVLS